MSLTKKVIVTFDAVSLATVRILLPAVSRHAARFAGSVFGAMGLVVSPNRRRRALDNLRKILVDASDRERKKIRRRCFIEFGAGFAETFHLHRKKRSYLRRFADVEGVERLRSAASPGKGVIIVGSHLSNFPFGMLALSGMGFPVAALIRAADNARVEEMNNEIRSHFGLSWIYVKPREKAARDCLRWLSAGGILWVLVDQRNRNGIVAKFLGQLSQVAPGAALFAQKLGCPVLPAVTVRMDNSRYRVIIGSEIQIASSGDRTADLRENMEKFLEAVGQHVLKYPEQWTWFHKMWKVRKEALEE
jgi:KDO2-lipid IV(A) lauroyltransferase